MENQNQNQSGENSQPPVEREFYGIWIVDHGNRSKAHVVHEGKATSQEAALIEVQEKYPQEDPESFAVVLKDDYERFMVQFNEQENRARQSVIQSK